MDRIKKFALMVSLIMYMIITMVVAMRGFVESVAELNGTPVAHKMSEYLMIFPLSLFLFFVVWLLYGAWVATGKSK